jgi:hypothetical protein
MPWPSSRHSLPRRTPRGCPEKRRSWRCSAVLFSRPSPLSSPTALGRGFARPADYLRTATVLKERLPPETVFFSAHRAAPPGVPTLRYEDLADLRRALEAIREGALASEMPFPRVFRVNAGLTICADLPSLENWEVTAPAPLRKSPQAATKRSQSAEPSAARTRIALRIRQLVAGRTGLEPTTSGRNTAKTQGTGELKLVSRCIPTSPRPAAAPSAVGSGGTQSARCDQFG